MNRKDLNSLDPYHCPSTTVSTMTHISFPPVQPALTLGGPRSLVTPLLLSRGQRRWGLERILQRLLSVPRGDRRLLRILWIILTHRESHWYPCNHRDPTLVSKVIKTIWWVDILYTQSGRLSFHLHKQTGYNRRVMQLE